MKIQLAGLGKVGVLSCLMLALSANALSSELSKTDPLAPTVLLPPGQAQNYPISMVQVLNPHEPGSVYVAYYLADQNADITIQKMTSPGQWKELARFPYADLFTFNIDNSGRLVFVGWNENESETTQATDIAVSINRSSDQGATWTSHQFSRHYLFDPFLTGQTTTLPDGRIVVAFVPALDVIYDGNGDEFTEESGLEVDREEPDGTWSTSTWFEPWLWGLTSLQADQKGNLLLAGTQMTLIETAQNYQTSVAFLSQNEGKSWTQIGSGTAKPDSTWPAFLDRESDGSLVEADNVATDGNFWDWGATNIKQSRDDGKTWNAVYAYNSDDAGIGCVKIDHEGRLRFATANDSEVDTFVLEGSNLVALDRYVSTGAFGWAGCDLNANDALVFSGFVVATDGSNSSSPVVFQEALPAGFNGRSLEKND